MSGVPVQNFLEAGTVPVHNFLEAGTVPVHNFLKAGTVPVNNFFLSIIIFFVAAPQRPTYAG